MLNATVATHQFGAGHRVLNFSRNRRGGRLFSAVGMRPGRRAFTPWCWGRRSGVPHFRPRRLQVVDGLPKATQAQFSCIQCINWIERFEFLHRS